MNSKEVKEHLYSLGADICGIASINRFEEAPEGFHPLDVLPATLSLFLAIASLQEHYLAALRCHIQL